MLAVFKPDWHRTAAQVQRGSAGDADQRRPHLRRHHRPAAAHARQGTAAAQAVGAWQAVIALLAFNIVIHFLHFPHLLSVSAFVANRPARRPALPARRLLRGRRPAHPADRAAGLRRPRRDGLRDRARLPGGRARSPEATRSPSGSRTCFTSCRRLRAASSGRRTARADLYHFLTSALGAFTLVVTIYLFLRSAQPRARLAAADAVRIRELLDRYGDRDSLGYFALRDDKSVIWSPSGKAGICYRVVAGVMLASGDPLGDSEAWPGAIAAFLAEAARHAWRPAVMGCSELGAEVWCREGDLTALELGDEAIVNVARVQPRRTPDAQRQADGQPRRQERVHRGGPPGRRHTAAGARRDHQGGGPAGGAPRSSGDSPWRSAASAPRATRTASW